MRNFIPFTKSLDEVLLSQTVKKAQDAFWAKVEAKGINLLSEDSLVLAGDAFWHEVAVAYPQVHSGDYPPDLTISFENVCEEEAEFKLLGKPKENNYSFDATCKSAVQWWLYYNMPE